MKEGGSKRFDRNIGGQICSRRDQACLIGDANALDVTILHVHVAILPRAGIWQQRATFSG